MKIGLVSCVKRKLSVPAPAKELYVSTLFKKSRQWAERNCDEWYVLSAKYGLVSPGEIIRPYELALKSFSAADRKHWASRVHQMMCDAGLLQSTSHFVWLAGYDYRQELSILLKQYPQSNPLKGLRFGPRLKWLGKEPATWRAHKSSRME